MVRSVSYARPPRPALNCPTAGTIKAWLYVRIGVPRATRHLPASKGYSDDTGAAETSRAG